MKNTLVKVFMGVFMLTLISSCTVYQKGINSAPLNAQVNFDMDDLEFVGIVEGTATQSYFIGIPIGNFRNTRGVVLSQGFSALTNPLDRGSQNALYDALMQKPDADFVLPFSVETTRHQMFLGSQVEYKLRAKAFKLKTK